MEGDKSRGRSRGRGRGEQKLTENKPGVSSTPEESGEAGVGRGRARGRGNRLDSPSAAGRALLRVPQLVQPGQDLQQDQASVAAVSRSLASTHIDTEGKTGGDKAVKKSPVVTQRAFLKTKPDSIDSKKGKTCKLLIDRFNYMLQQLNAFCFR